MIHLLAQNAGQLTVTSSQIMWFALAAAAILLTGLGLFLHSLNRMSDKRNELINHIAANRSEMLKEIGENRTQTLLQGQRIQTIESDFQAVRKTLHDINNSMMNMSGSINTSMATMNVAIAKITVKMGLNGEDHHEEH